MLKEQLARLPFLRFLLPFITGILLAFIIGRLPAIGLALAISAFILLGLLLFVLLRVFSFRGRWLFGAVLSVMMMLTSFILVQFKMDAADRIESNFAGEALVADVLDMPGAGNNSVRIAAKVRAVKKAGQWTRTGFRILVYLEKDSLVDAPGPGSSLLINGGIKDFYTAGNPGEFDYPRYMRDRGFYGSVYAGRNDWKSIERKSGFSLLIISARIREYLFYKLGTRLEGEELAVCSALLLGKRDYLSEEVRDSFSRAGVMHVMAVSGLHVGIIYLLLYYLFFFMDGFRKGRFLRISLILIFLWLYALITGLSPSVLRATIMFSFLVIGQNLGRNTNIYNNLALSAFILLLINPFLLRNAGFQLSYLAVGGIVFLYPRIYALLSPKFLLIDKLWSLFCLSLSAQLSTFPLVIYYFHQFPNLFFISNIVVIPLVGIIIYLGFLSYILSFSNILFDIFTYLLNLVSAAVVLFVKYMGTPDIAVSSHLYLDIASVLLIYMTMIFAGIYFVYKRKSYAVAALALLVVFAAYSMLLNLKAEQSSSFAVLNAGRQGLVRITEGRKSYVFVSEHGRENQEAIYYALAGLDNKMRIRSEKICFRSGEKSSSFINNDCTEGKTFSVEGDLLVFSGMKVYLTDIKSIPRYNFPAVQKIDMLILSGPGRAKASDMLAVFRPGIVIFDSSVPAYLSAKLSKEFRDKHISSYDVRKQGAFYMKE